MKISEVYKKYQIPEHLQLHMYRVAGVSALICDHFNQDIDRDLIVSSCLLHDMGNIVKFDFSLNPEKFNDKGINYWKNVQKKIISRYGKDDHEATMNIVEELNVDNKILEIIDNIAFSRAEAIYKSENYNLKITSYSDQRVSIYGVVSMKERHREGRKRYLKRPDIKVNTSEKEFEKLSEWMRRLEAQIFDHTDINPKFISEETVTQIIPDLYNFKIK